MVKMRRRGYSDPRRGRPTAKTSAGAMTTVAKTRTYDGNAEAIEAWNGVLFDKFDRFRHIICDGLAVVGAAALERHPPSSGARVLDVGCGFGDSTRDIALRVGGDGEAIGVDAAARFIEVAQKEAAAAGTRNARFRVADVQFDDLGGPYDCAFSRFGTMFFVNPVAALRNVRGALKDGGALTMTVWRKKEDNPWLYDVERTVQDIVPLPPSTNEVTCGPGPFSMASADLVSAQLLAAGFDHATFERFDTPIRIGDSIADAIEFSMVLGPAGELIRLAGEEGAKQRPRVVTALEEVLAAFARPDGIYGDASTWIVTARAN
jgi:ubiquinone/menaquinone biosynthesis C-methylase UbiE